MDIRSKKGIRGLAVIHKIEEITENWCYHKDEKPDTSCSRPSDLDQYRPRIKFGSYNNPEQPQYGVYKKHIRPSMDGSDALVMTLSGLKSYARVYVDGELLKELQPMDCSVSLDAFCQKGELELSIYYEQKTIQESNELRILLYEGYRMKEISCRGADEKQLVSYIEGTHDVSSDEGRPMQLMQVKLLPGEMALFSAGFHLNEIPRKDLRFKVSGRDVKLLLILNGKMMGRLWLPTAEVRPLFKGGDETLLSLPKSYFHSENRIELIVEAMLGDPEIMEVFFE
jgi:beta-galactosidase